MKVIATEDWRGASTGAALEVARRVATMAEIIESFILREFWGGGFLFFKVNVRDNSVLFFGLRDFELFDVLLLEIPSFNSGR